jgi:hypothetical protein
MVWWSEWIAARTERSGQAVVLCAIGVCVVRDLGMSGEQVMSVRLR